MKAPKFMAALAVLVLVEASLHAQTAPVLQPVKPWVVHFDETGCYAERAYGTGDNPVILGIRPSPNGDTYELLLAHRRPAPRYAQQLEGSVDFGQSTHKAWVLRYGIKEQPYTIDKFRIDSSTMVQAQKAASAGFHISKLPEERLALASMPGVLTMLEKCNEDLRRYWNMTDVGQKQIAKPARGDVRRVFTSSDYPAEAFDRGQGGETQLLLFVDEKGAIAACHVLQPSGIPALDGMGCQVIRQRARFKPATDVKGKTIRSSVVTPPIIWQLYDR